MHYYLIQAEHYGIGFAFGVFLMLVISFIRNND